MAEQDECQRVLNDAFTRLGQAVGVHVMVLVCEHALWRTRLEYSGIQDLISVSEDGFTADKLRLLPPEESSRITHNLLTEMIATLGRLVGVGLAQELIEKLDVNISHEGV